MSDLQTEPSLFVDDAVLTARNVLDTHTHPVVTISGGSDSDVMLDILSHTGEQNFAKCTFVFINTGLEYQATLKHLDYLEDRYKISIDRVRAGVPVPRAIRRKGIPVFSKYASEMIYRLQKYGFDWTDDRPMEALFKDYPRCIQQIRWWTGYYDREVTKGYHSHFSISRMRLLKEYIIDNPPDFRISNRCCDLSKKAGFHNVIEKYDADLNVMGVRRAEGGIRASIKTCYSKHEGGPDQYRPIFWLSNDDKSAYCRENGIIHSDCYRVWGFKRTGCTGCPYNPKFREELAIIEKYEPKMAHAARCTFGRSYDYQDAFKEYRQAHDLAEKNGKTVALDKWM